jgi:hypothetical protein
MVNSSVAVSELKNQLVLAIKAKDDFAVQILIARLFQNISKYELSQFLIEQKIIDKKCYFCKVKCDNPECDLEPARNSIDKGVKND